MREIWFVIVFSGCRWPRRAPAAAQAPAADPAAGAEPPWR